MKNEYENLNTFDFKSLFNNFIELFIIKVKKLSGDYVSLYLNKKIENTIIKEKYGLDVYFPLSFYDLSLKEQENHKEIFLNIVFEELVMSIEYMNTITNEDFLIFFRKLSIQLETYFEFLKLNITLKDENTIYNVSFLSKKFDNLKKMKI